MRYARAHFPPLAGVQWNLRIADTIGTHLVVLCREAVLFRRLFCIECVYLVCPLLGGLSSFGVSFIRGFTVDNFLEVAWGLTGLFHNYVLFEIKWFHQKLGGAHP